MVPEPELVHYAPELVLDHDPVFYHHGDICDLDIWDVWKPTGGKLLVATAGGIRVDVVKDALKAGADILVVGRAITASKDISHAADEFLDQLNREEIDQFRVMTDF